MLPGNITSAASPGRGRPGSTISTVTFGSATNGSRSSKFEIRASRGTAILIFPPGRVAISMTSSAGNFQASENQGKTPRFCQLVCFSIAVTPPSNSETSPRNLLMANPLILIRSLSGSTIFVPTICAITPPRSISPIKITGTLAASAKPIFAISPSRKFISAGLPAPSMIIKSVELATRKNDSKTFGIN